MPISRRINFDLQLFFIANELNYEKHNRISKESNPFFDIAFNDVMVYSL